MEDIDRLLQKFYAGETTPDEERHLKNSILGSVDERWADDRRLFDMLYNNVQPEAPADVSARIATMLRGLDAKDERRPNVRRLYYWLGGAAAAVALLCVGLFYATHTDNDRMMADTYDDPAEAARMAEKTLLYVSAQLNRGIDKTYVVGEEISKMHNVLNKNFENKQTNK